MGLLKAGIGAAAGVLSDSWRDYFYCEALDADTLVAKGAKRVNSKGRSSNTKGDDNIISNGSIIAVADGQCMIIVEQGAIVEFCSDPGEFVWDSSTQPSVFYGGFGEGIKKSFAEFSKRVGFGGDTGTDQRIYYFNTKEIVGNKYGTSTPVPFRVVDANIGLDIDTAVRMNGVYSYRLADPILFYKNVCGNVESTYTRDQIDPQMKSEILTSLQPALAQISGMGIRYSAVPAHTKELADALNEEMSKDWRDLRGTEIVSFGVNSIAISPEDEEMIKQLQRTAVMRDPSMSAANLSAAQAEAMKAAASNEAGAMTGFMGLGMAGMTGTGMAASMPMPSTPNPPQSVYGASPTGGFGAPQGTPSQAPAAGSPAGTQATGWTCQCGTANTGKFCSNCGQPQPQPQGEWVCQCGTPNTGRFCGNCGQPQPQGPWTCQCGTANEGKFCSNCGQGRP